MKKVKALEKIVQENEVVVLPKSLEALERWTQRNGFTIGSDIAVLRSQIDSLSFAFDKLQNDDQFTDTETNFYNYLEGSAEDYSPTHSSTHSLTNKLTHARMKRIRFPGWAHLPNLRHTSMLVYALLLVVVVIIIVIFTIITSLFPVRHMVEICAT